MNDMTPVTEQILARERFQTEINAAPLGVYQADSGDYRLIPAGIQPIVVSDSLWQSVQDDALAILAALEKVVAWLRRPEQRQLSHSLFVELGPIERGPADYAGLATARLDLFFDADQLKVIEVNTTIPAMQAYSDMIKQAYTKAFWPAAQGALQSNSEDLLTSLLWHYQRTGGKKSSPRIAIVARPGDSQQAELLWLQRSWQAKGFETQLLTPMEVELSRGELLAKSGPIDLSYRHIFAHRLQEASAFAEACRQSETYRVFNPIAAHLEAKASFAELSQIASDPRLSQAARLSDAEQAATLRRVAWSRVLRSGPSLSPDLELIPDLFAWVKQHPSKLVLKHSLGYGGRGVFIGSEFAESVSQMRVRQMLGSHAFFTWVEFVEAIQSGKLGSWIVQERIAGRKMSQSLLAEGVWKEQEHFVDCSVFASSGLGGKASGGVCRFATDAIVNIAGGGGLVPFFTESEFRGLAK